MTKKVFILITAMIFGMVVFTESAQAQRPSKQNKDSFYFYKIVNIDFEAAVTRVKETLKEQGFGVVSEINMQQKITQATGKEMDAYVILGACNPQGAYEALQLDAHIGLLLPCNIIVRSLGNDRVEVAAINPEKTLENVKKPEMKKLAKEIGEKLQLAIANI